MLKFINYISFIPTILVSIYALFQIKHLDGTLKWFRNFVFLSGLIEISSRILWFNSKNNLPLLHLYVAAGFFCLNQFYEDLFQGVIDKTITRIVLILFLGFTIINSIFYEGIFTFNSNALTVQSILLVVYSMFCYNLMVNDLMKKKFDGMVGSINWINSGIFIYYASSLLIFHFGDIITKLAPSSMVDITWVVYSFFSMVMYGCFFIGIWKIQRK